MNSVAALVILLEVLAFTPSKAASNDLYNDYYNDDLFLLDSNVQKVEILDDLPLQDARLLRDNKQDVTNITATTASAFQNLETNADADQPDGSESSGAAGVSSSSSSQEWIEEAIKDVAWYLRAHKFNEYDRRYEANGTLAPRTYHREYPRPPLRSLHWEVHKFCDESFLACIRYLWKRTQGADLRRGDDTSVVIQEQHWRMDDDRERIDMVEAECKKLKRRDDILAEPFQGPLERFQWRTTASYFMCWFAMNGVEYLRHITEDCDNFANCLDSQFGARNRDPRANDDTPFACALYSFCPDPCCHEKHISNLNSCWDMPQVNPCYSASPPGQKECSLNRSQNLDFTSTILNHWNVTCACPQAGYVWDSSYGICVDVDECLGEHKCDVHRGEACLNTVGGYKCVCKWGHTWSNEGQACEKNEAISQIALIALKMLKKKVDEENQERSYLRRLFNYLKKLTMKNTNSTSNSTEANSSSHIALNSFNLITFLIVTSALFVITDLL